LVVVISQTRTLDADEHADGYVEGSRRFIDFMKQHPGFKGRLVLRSTEDPQHFMHVRVFDTVESYRELTDMPGYHDRIDEMGAHCHQPPQREYFEIVIDDLDSQILKG